MGRKDFEVELELEFSQFVLPVSVLFELSFETVRGEYSVRVPAPWCRLSFFKIWPFPAKFHITHTYSV